jgi:hypothetical protein
MGSGLPLLVAKTREKVSTIDWVIRGLELSFFPSAFTFSLLLRTNLLVELEQVLCLRLPMLRTMFLAPDR